MKKKIFFLVLLIIFISVCGFFSFQTTSYEIENVDKLVKEEPIGLDLNKRKLTQTFDILTDTIEGIKIKTATFDKIPSGSMTMNLLQNNEVIFSKLIEGKEILNNNVIDINFEKKIEVLSKTFTVEFDLSKLTDKTPITFYVKALEGAVVQVGEDKLNNQTLFMQYYVKGFSLRRFCYLLGSVTILIAYTGFVLKIIKRK